MSGGGGHRNHPPPPVPVVFQPEVDKQKRDVKNRLAMSYGRRDTLQAVPRLLGPQNPQGLRSTLG